ncbi:hypothetical protein [Flavobacterium agrisoli]|uniref:Uncharacterized protein n=1 Tax=Flavobacterium agrisoli TaxID=2793066 RepID=A0A934PPF7_9FLAO|nr:hypothetical protein [Flavobacterium agrisoli]MBK0370504.1 hypothetical protein [Flavobacterium agrisoli]
MPLPKHSFVTKFRPILLKLSSDKAKIIYKTILLTFFLSYFVAFICAQIGILEIDWQLLYLPALLVLQIIIIGHAIKNRYKKN